VIPYVVRAGDHFEFLAHRYGFDPDQVWNDPRNSDLRQLRKSPNILCSGDLLYIPEPPPAKTFHLKVGSLNSFTTTIPTVTVSISFTRGDKPLAGATAQITGVDPPQTLTTDGDGKLQLTLPIDVRVVTVAFPDIPLVRTVRVGYLDPINKPTGVLQRLQNLRYAASGASAATSGIPILARAVAAFQRDNGLDVTGEADSATQDALEKAHGC
jgi:hypothetical protein